MDATPSAAPNPPPGAAPAGALEEHVLVPRRSLAEDARFDITAMVDLVFMMNIFFLVSWVGAALAEVDLPAARHCVAADADTCVIVTVTSGESGNPSVYLGDASAGAEISAGEVEARITAAVQAGTREGKNMVLIKAEKQVRLRDITRIAGAAVAVPGVKLNLAVMEKE